MAFESNNSVKKMIEQYKLNFSGIEFRRRKNPSVETHLDLLHPEPCKDFNFQVFPVKLLFDSTLQVFFNEDLHFLFFEFPETFPCIRMIFLKIIKERLVDFHKSFLMQSIALMISSMEFSECFLISWSSFSCPASSA